MISCYGSNQRPAKAVLMKKVLGSKTQTNFIFSQRVFCRKGRNFIVGDIIWAKVSLANNDEYK